MSIKTQSQVEEENQESLTTSLAELMYPFYKRFVDGSDLVTDTQRELKYANISTPVELYYSKVIGYGGITALLITFTSFFGFLVALPVVIGDPTLGNNPAVENIQFVSTLLNSIQHPITAMILASVSGILGFGGVFVSAIYYPKLVKNSRKNEINVLLGDTLGFMYSLSVGGTNQIDILRAVAEAEDTYGEVSVEFQRIIHEMKYFNVDYQTAVENATERTPSNELEEFLSDMLSVVNSGGDVTDFLDRKQERLREKSKNRQEEMLDTLELFGQVYLALNILPMGLLIVLVITSMLGEQRTLPLIATAYGVIPAINILFGVLITSVKNTEPGDGKLGGVEDVKRSPGITSVRNLGVVDSYSENSELSVFDSIQTSEFRYRVQQVLQNPWKFFRLNPTYTLFITVPVMLLFLLMSFLTGLITIDPSVIHENTYSQTVIWFYIPVIVVLTPLAMFTYSKKRTRGRITDTLTEDIRKLASANETGQPVVEALREAAEGRDTLLSTEFKKLHKKAKFGTNLSAALVTFNNKYKRPRLARIVKLIDKAQESSSNIAEVLNTAAKTSRYQDELIESRRQRTRIQVVVIGVTFLVFLGVLSILDSFLLGRLVKSAASSAAQQTEQLSGVGVGISLSSIPVQQFSTYYFHAITLQAVCAGVISGYVQTGEISSSYKYIIGYLVLAMIGWGLIAV